MHRSTVAAACFVGMMGWILIGPQALADNDDGARIEFVGDKIVFELLGQVVNFPTPAPLGSSIQYGYLTRVRGIESSLPGAHRTKRPRCSRSSTK